MSVIRFVFIITLLYFISNNQFIIIDSSTTKDNFFKDKNCSKEVTNYLKKQVIDFDFQKEVVNSYYCNETRIITLFKKTNLYRYFGGGSIIKGYYFNLNKIRNYRSKLSLPLYNTCEKLVTFEKKRKIKVIKGRAYPLFGEKGFIFIFNIIIIFIF
jgi:hypothetical protein